MTTKQPLTVVQANKTATKLRLLLVGDFNAGKSYTGMSLAKWWAEKIGGTWGVIDAEGGAASEYADVFGNFDLLTLPAGRLAPEDYVEAISIMQQRGVDFLFIDGFTPEWDTLLADVDNANASDSGKSRDSWGAWRKATPRHNAFLQAIRFYPGHLCGTVRAKSTKVKTSGIGGDEVRVEVLDMKQRDGFGFEFGLIANMWAGGTMTMARSRSQELNGKTFVRPGPEVFELMYKWVTEGAMSKQQFVEEVIELGFNPDEIPELTKKLKVAGNAFTLEQKLAAIAQHVADQVKNG